MARGNASNKVVAIVQARMGSTRLPGKAMAEAAGKPLIHYVLTRTAKSNAVDEVWLACSKAKADAPLAAYARKIGFPVFRGSEDDVLGRFAAAAAKSGAVIVVRVTGDCPLIDPDLIDLAVTRFRKGGVDYVSNATTRTFPDGLDVEVFSRAALDQADAEARDPMLRAHVTPFISGRLADRLPAGDFRRTDIVGAVDFSHLRWTVDEPEDLELMRRLIPLLPDDFHWNDVLAILTQHPELLRINRSRKTNEGAIRDLEAGGDKPAQRFDRSNALFENAAEMIPLASQTFSKSHQQMVKGASPLFMESGKGCRVTDADGNRYIDYLMGLMPVILGYGDADVDAAIAEQMERGITFSQPSPIEAELAERLIRLVPCAEMVRFGKNGSDATTAAVRLARAHTGRDRIAVCGYHGWHDWYIGTTARDLGVPAAVKELSAGFPFNDADALEALLKAEPNGYAAVIVEPAGATPPASGFLQRLRELTEHYGAVLIFDEIVTGFRVALGGAQAYYGVTPDLAAFGKSMGNGMPISAIVGRREIMTLMETIFFSATFGGETLSIAAAIATIDKLEREFVAERLWARGEVLGIGANRLLDRHGFGNFARFEGDGWWPRLVLGEAPVDNVLLASLLRQEFVANGLLLLASFNLCLAHDSDAISDETLAAIDRALGAVRAALDSPDPSACLRGDPIQPTFAVR